MAAPSQRQLALASPPLQHTEATTLYPEPTPDRARHAQGEADFQGLAAADPNATKLYGLWQTVPYNAPAALDGKVPKNERGNVQVPPFVTAMPEVRAGPQQGLWGLVEGAGCC